MTASMSSSVMLLRRSASMRAQWRACGLPGPPELPLLQRPAESCSDAAGFSGGGVGFGAAWSAWSAATDVVSSGLLFGFALRGMALPSWTVLEDGRPPKIILGTANAGL